MRIKMLVIGAILCSGCAMFKGPAEPLGIRDYLELNPGTVITGVSLPTDEKGKTYNVVLEKPTACFSLEAWNRMERK